ncbi:hydrogenase maturation protease [Saccharopolyspora montiporae]|uniref:hydrogenase maturation protease n=1 Tax=Saccharopolyspora montiporae TaxID=2781240 RepID=UPI00351C4103
MTGRVLVAGIGNIFLGDDGFGCEVACRLGRVDLPAHVVVSDYGIRGLHLAYDLLDGCAGLVLADALPGDRGPGALHVLQIGEHDLPDGAGIDAHGMHPAAVLANVPKLGGTLPRTVVVGCEPQDTGEGIGLSDVVRKSAGEAVDVIRDLVGTWDVVPVPGTEQDTPGTPG